ncbi:MAG: amino acid adenylation domain-containing protein, partial [Acidobacteriota bacterium]
RPATAAEHARFEDVERLFSSEFTTRLASLAQSLHVTLNTVIQSMWAVVTSTYSRQQDVVFGVTVSGRPAELPGADRTAGLFINTLPIRVDVAPERSVAGLLREIQRTQSAMSPFEQTSLVDVQRASGVRGRALFESIFVFENYPLGQSLGDAPLRDFAVRDARSIEWTHYPLTCFVTPGSELRVRLVYDTARFERGPIERMLEYAAEVLEGFASRPGEAIGRVAAVRVPQQTVERTPLALVHERFVAQAKQWPERVALAFAGAALTYRQLDEKSNRLANDLRQSGFGPELVAGIFMDRSPEMMIALLATLKAGGAYLPLDPRFPAARVAMTLEDAAPLLILTQEHLVARLPESKARVITIDTDCEEIERESSQLPSFPASRLESSADHANLAYVIFTSGSTGRPKGVEVSHRALTNLLHSFEDRPGMTAADVLLAVTTLSFDIAALELFLPLMCGATVVMASAEDAVDGERLAALLEQHRVTVMQATPATWRLLLLAGWHPPRSLRMWCGGEAMPTALAEDLRVNGSELWNVYGPTETTIWSAIHPVAGRDDARVVGGAVANTTLTVVDANLNAVPIGVQGELLIGGDGVARGYRNRPALTAEKFVPDPTASMAGARAYRTGDQVRMRDDGAIEFLGRDDAQVKIRGFRVELGEIEAAIRAIEGVRDTVVVHRDGRLIAYVARNERPAEDGVLTAALRQTLPDYMVPGVWVDLEAIPLTPNRKVDRNALPSPEAVTSEWSLVRPRTALEEVLVGVWKETLGVDRVGIRDNFFSLGGHSLHAAQIVAWLRRVFQTKIPLRILFEASTIENLAQVLSQHHANTPETAEAVLKIREMLPEERARRIASRRLREDVVE